MKQQFDVFPWSKPEWINYYDQKLDLTANKTPYQKEVHSQVLQDVIKRVDKVVEFVNPRNTSQNCSGCHNPVTKNLSIRVHNCPFCGLVLDRDHNAAINILKRSINTVGTTGINARQGILNRGSMQRDA